MSPVITIFVRHGDDCKYRADEFSKRCTCRKHFRWTHGGQQHRQKAGTRSWAEAEELKRKLEDQLAGKTPKKETTATVKDAIDTFVSSKRVEGITEDVLAKYTRELGRLRAHCENAGVITVAGITPELLIGYCGTWERAYPSSQTRSVVRTRTRSFLRFCYESEWLKRIPSLPKIKVEEPPTMPLEDDEYAALILAAETVRTSQPPAKVRALFQLMRWSGLAITDALTLPKREVQYHREQNRYRIETSRQKTGVHVSVVIPNEIAKEVLAVSGDPYIFWDGESDITKSWQKYVIVPVFDAAKIEGEGNMRSHRFRDTFAVHLLNKGVPLEEVSKALGHESIKTTEKHYAKWVKLRQDRLDGLIAATWS